MKTLKFFFFFLLFTYFMGNTPADARGRISLSIGMGRGWPEPIFHPGDLQLSVRRLQKARKEWFEQAKASGAFDNAPKDTKAPHWATCQKIALQNRPEMLLIRMNWAGVKAAIAMLKGELNFEYEDQLGEKLPFGFDAESWGSEILRDFSLAGWSKSKKLRVLRSANNQIREIFTTVRDEINRDAVFAQHECEAAKGTQINLALWRLWFELGLIPTSKK